MDCCQNERLTLFNIETETDNQIVLALAGNPNVGKTTLFNALTGMRQHTGNWPGKTVTRAQGSFQHAGQSYLLVDLPGTYSLLSNSADEQIARDFICFGNPAITLVVVDATALERNLNLALQVLEITSNVIVCVNLLDEAEKKGISVDTATLAHTLGVPVVGMSARSNRGIGELLDSIQKIMRGEVVCTPIRLMYSPDVEAAVARKEAELTNICSNTHISPRWLALRLLEGDTTILASMKRYLGEDSMAVVKEVALHVDRTATA